MIRIYFYCLSAIASALVGWSLGQFFVYDVGLELGRADLIIFPCVAASLAVGIVANEVFISNPTRPKINLRILKPSIIIATALGLGIGLLAGIFAQILYLPWVPLPDVLRRASAWLVIGLAVGLAEGLTWRWRSIEAGDKKRFKRRVMTSVIGAVTASAVAAIVFEILSVPLGQVEGFLEFFDPFGFSILGLLLGITFSFSNSPSYMAALRAGEGFEYRQIDRNAIDTLEPDGSSLSDYPTIKVSSLQFVGSGHHRIEEGLSIQLPPSGSIRIGSASKKTPDIYLPNTPLHAASLNIYSRYAILEPNPIAFHTIEVNGEYLHSRDNVILKHNSLLTFHTLNPESNHAKKLYRLVYYNRFLDPQS